MPSGNDIATAWPWLGYSMVSETKGIRILHRSLSEEASVKLQPHLALAYALSGTVRPRNIAREHLSQLGSPTIVCLLRKHPSKNWYRESSDALTSKRCTDASSLPVFGCTVPDTIIRFFEICRLLLVNIILDVTVNAVFVGVRHLAD
ncbi:hypothetical protein O9992_22050 [Vibrio lentus]|nr:hypothetical protein [Vibrio lentus]